MSKPKSRPTDSVSRCAAQHFGPWMVDSQWFAQAVAAVKAGTFQPMRPQSALAPPGEDDDYDKDPAPADDAVVGDWSGDVFKVRYFIEGGVARIPFFGQVTKGDSSFGGASSVWTRQSIRRALNDGRVSEILLHIDSPGGTVSGTGDLADDVAAADERKPCYTYFEDLGASAAYWIGSQSRRIFANPTAQVGSIGTMTWVEDTSGMYEKAGIKVTLIATGKYKGQWIDGNPVSEDYIESVRTEVEDLNEHFLAGVERGRGMTREQLLSVADGRCFIADKAKTLGLIDDVSTLDAAMAAIQVERKSRMNPETFRAYAAANPEAAEVKEIRQAGIVAGHKAGKAEGIQEERDRCLGVNKAHGLENHPATASITAGDDIDTAKRIADVAAKAKADAESAAKVQADAAKAENERLAKELAKKEFEASGQRGVNSGTRAEGEKKEGESAADNDDPKAVAAAEWDKDPAACKAQGFASKAAYVGLRAAELSGKFRQTRVPA